MIGHHPGIKKLRELARKVAFQNNNVLIVGETGTGKEIVAQSIHRMSARKNAPFVALKLRSYTGGADRKYPVWNCKRLVYRKFGQDRAFGGSRQGDALSG